MKSGIIGWMKRRELYAGRGGGQTVEMVKGKAEKHARNVLAAWERRNGKKKSRA